MKRIGIILGIILFLVSQNPSLVWAQSKASPGSGGITLSPTLIEIGSNDLGKTFSINLANNSGQDIHLYAEEKYIKRGADGQTIPVENSSQQSMLQFTPSDFILAANSSYDFKVTVKADAQVLSTYPAIVFSDQNNGGKVALTTQLYTIFLIQNIKGTLAVDSSLSTNQANFALRPDFVISGSIKNIGDKFFNPSGTLSVYKGGTKIYEKEITSQVQGLLFPDEQKQFQIDWSNNLGGLQSIGNYTIQTTIKALPFNQTFVSTIKVFYVPADVILLIIPLIATIIILLVIKKQLSNKSKKASLMSPLNKGS